MSVGLPLQNHPERVIPVTFQFAICATAVGSVLHTAAVAVTFTSGTPIYQNPGSSTRAVFAPFSTTIAFA